MHLTFIETVPYKMSEELNKKFAYAFTQLWRDHFRIEAIRIADECNDDLKKNFFSMLGASSSVERLEISQSFKDFEERQKLLKACAKLEKILAHQSINLCKADKEDKAPDIDQVKSELERSCMALFSFLKENITIDIVKIIVDRLFPEMQRDAENLYFSVEARSFVKDIDMKIEELANISMVMARGFFGEQRINPFLIGHDFRWKLLSGVFFVETNPIYWREKKSQIKTINDNYTSDDDPADFFRIFITKNDYCAEICGKILDYVIRDLAPEHFLAISQRKKLANTCMSVIRSEHTIQSYSKRVMMSEIVNIIDQVGDVDNFIDSLSKESSLLEISQFGTKDQDITARMMIKMKNRMSASGFLEGNQEYSEQLSNRMILEGSRNRMLHALFDFRDLLSAYFLKANNIDLWCRAVTAILDENTAHSGFSLKSESIQRARNITKDLEAAIIKRAREPKKAWQ